MKLTTKEKITKAIIQMQNEQPFWARLILGFKIEENKEITNGMCVDFKGNISYKKEFIEELSNDELKFVLAHETNHVIFKHLIRLGKRDPKLFNICCDVVVNTILKLNHFIPPNKGIFANDKFEFEIGGKIIENIDKKVAEQVYDEMPQGNQESFEGFDEHIFGELNENEMKQAEESMNEQIIQAQAYAQQRGKAPLGMDRYLNEIIMPKIGWKTLLYRYITNSLISDYSWTRPSKKSISCGIILPNVIKENLEIVVHIDTSGSISQDILTTFLSEIIGIAKSFKNIKCTVIECDCAIHQILEVKNGNIDKIKRMKMKGCGGTSHKPIWQWLKKKQCKVLISFTDMKSDIEKSDKPRCDVVWVVPERIEAKALFGKIIKVR